MSAMSAANLDVDLSALRENYSLLRARHAKNAVAAVVKADAYGLGVAEISRALWAEGCRDFFVATLEEGIELRSVLSQADIGVFDGVLAGEEKDFAVHDLTPVLNTPEMITRWQKQGGRAKMVHIDTGMTRLGLSASQVEQVAPLVAGDAPLIISHLACADTPLHAQNTQQLAKFKKALAHFSKSRASLANSAGIFLSPDFHFDLGRPGCALYGIGPAEGKNPMRHVATLSAPLLQVSTLEEEVPVGYGATHIAKKGARIAVAGIGYADGYFRSLSNLGAAYVGGVRVPVVGRVSMDMVTLDVSAVPESKLGESAQFISEQLPVDEVAASANTIGYEVFTRLGARVKRTYR